MLTGAKGRAALLTFDAYRVPKINVGCECMPFSAATINHVERIEDGLR